MQIELADEQRQSFTTELQKMFLNEFDIELSEYRAGEILNLCIKNLGPTVDNQAVQDVRAHLQRQLDDLDGEIYADR